MVPGSPSHNLLAENMPCMRPRPASNRCELMRLLPATWECTAPLDIQQVVEVAVFEPIYRRETESPMVQCSSSCPRRSFQ